MDVLMIILYVLGGLIVFTLVASLVAYFTLAVPAMKKAPPLSEADRFICEELVKRRQAYPFLCAQAIKRGACPCQPCPLLAKARGAA